MKPISERGWILVGGAIFLIVFWLWIVSLILKAIL